ncbi:MAG: protein-glutamate O-methyltransferase CheR [Polyangiaceae bacterium]|nr:protein-glutamate O-methyltransferase CheR [Polyangiaceae bacterium]
MEEPEIEETEISLLLEAIFQRYGYDFRSYARASIERRLRQFLSSSGCDSISGMIPKALRNKAFATTLIQHFSISVTEMFRDPLVYLAIRREVVPLLRTYPHVKVWHAGCATGEEVYSMAITLEEEGLLDKATIFGTDFNDSALMQAKEAIYPASKMKEYTQNYQQAGGMASFAYYYHAHYDCAMIDSALKSHITFANHNLVTDSVFGEMHLILCRNVLIYFNRALQERALGLLTDSLVRGGFLCIGSKETLELSDVRERYEVVDDTARIFKKRVL